MTKMAGGHYKWFFAKNLNNNFSTLIQNCSLSFFSQWDDNPESSLDWFQLNYKRLSFGNLVHSAS
jgi:hypothetical protein